MSASQFLRVSLVSLLLLTSCALRPDVRMPSVAVSANQRGFVQSNGKPFHPWGFNYDRDYRMRLLEEYWDEEWSTVAEDFREMNALGANLVRIHLQFGKFMNGPETPNPAALSRLASLLDLAEKTGLYLDITGLACYRKRDVPAWYDNLDEAGRWAAQARFWEAIAKTCARSPAVFCYNLMNEPLVPAKARGEKSWLVAHLVDLWYVQAITLDPAGRNRSDIAAAWIRQLTDAIRRHDNRHMITVGMLPNSLGDAPGDSGFVPAKIAPLLDFLCLHIYPGPASLEKDLGTLAGFNVGKPVIIEEIFPLDGGLDVVKTFMNRSGDMAVGWVTFYWGQTPEELKLSKEPAAPLIREWLEFFRTRGENKM